MPCDAVLLVNLSIRGDKDVWHTARAMGETLQP
jgi:tryptophan synthase beta subunit